MTTIAASAKMANNPHSTKATVLPVTRTKDSLCRRLLSRLSALGVGSCRLQGVSFAFLICAAFGVSLTLSGEAHSQIGFSIQNRPVGDFAGWAATSGVQVITGDFNGDGRTDIGLVRQAAGWATAPVALSSASGFTIENPPVGAFAGWAATSGVRVVTGDFNGDSRTDIGLVRQTAGWATVPVALAGFTTHLLGVRRFTTSVLTNADADRILADATTVLQTNDGPGDVACNVNLNRTGNVTVFADGDGSIDSAAEFNTIIGLAGHIKVVNQINWCGVLLPNVIGCAPVPGNSLVVVRFTTNQEGILWAHEFGRKRCKSINKYPAKVWRNTTERPSAIDFFSKSQGIKERYCVGCQATVA